ncbi:MAG: ethylbenzene dehydrogenase-related protein [Gemmatimonadota bacterium]
MALLVGALWACGSDDPGPTTPITPEGTFASVTKILQDDCSSCHGAGSTRSFLVTMDSASLVGSGFINPTDVAQSLLLFKPRSTTHGGGVITSFSVADSVALASWIAKQPASGATQLVAVRAIGAVGADGLDSEDSWRNAKWLAARIGGGWADATQVYLKALYDDQYIYLFLKWPDDVASYKRQPFMKQDDGTWRKMPAKPLPVDGSDWDTYMGKAFNEEARGLYYEDKLAIAWNTYGATTSPAFEQSGCAGLCHDPSKNGSPGTTYYYSDQKRAAKKYTNAPTEIVDLWHWKLVRQNEYGKMDDQFVRNWTVGDAGAADGGRASDVGTGGYSDALAAADGSPVYRGKSIAPGLFAYPKADTVRLTTAERDALPIGAMIASMWTAPLSGTRADIDGRGYYSPTLKMWNYEIKRKRVTGDANDVQFDDLARAYKFGIAVFDNAQIEHSWSPNVLRLVFQR